MKATTDYERLYKMFKPYSKSKEDDEPFCTFKENCIILYTDDSYCNVELFFDEKGKFTGFIK